MKIIAVSRPSTLLRVFLKGRLEYHAKGWNWGSPCNIKSLSFLLLLDITPNKKVESPCPSPDHRPHIAKKVSLRAFRQILPNIFPVAYIFSYIIITKVKKLIGTKSFDTKQYQVGLSSRIIPNYPPNGDREEP